MESASPFKIVFLDRATIAPQIRLRPPAFEHEWIEYPGTQANEVDSRIAQADIVIVNKVKLTASALSQAHQLKFIALAATGTDNVDLSTCQQRGILVSNVRNYAVHTVPEHTFALIFALRRSICAYRDAVRAGRWQDSAQFCFFDYPIRDLAGSVLGVIGDGTLGQAVGKMGSALGMRVQFLAYKNRFDPARHYVPLLELLESSDVITLHCPLRPETRNLIGAPEFAQMKQQPLLINTGRGGLVDESALAAALQTGAILGAAFDVASVEPPAADHLLMQLVDLPNFILTPHIAWASDQAMQTLANQLIANVEAFVRGQALNLVSP